MKKLTIWFSRTPVYSFLVMKIIPFIRFSVYYTSLRGDKYNRAYNELEPGDFILSVDFKKGTSFLVPGFMTHASFCVAKKVYHKHQLYEVAEMTHHNYTKSDFFDICKEADRVIICTCTDWTSDDKAEMIQIVKKLSKAKYDTVFNLTNGLKSLYCSELVYQGDKLGPNKLKVDLSDLHSLGTKYISPDGLLFGYNVKVKHDTGGEFNGLSGPEVERACKALGYIK